MALHIDPMPDNESVQAVMYGPLVLAGRFDDVSTEMSFSGMGPKSGMQTKVPDIIADSRPASWIESDAKESLTFHSVGQSQPLTLVPLNRIMHQRYAVYWNVNHKSS